MDNVDFDAAWGVLQTAWAEQDPRRAANTGPAPNYQVESGWHQRDMWDYDSLSNTSDIHPVTAADLAPTPGYQPDSENSYDEEDAWNYSPFFNTLEKDIDDDKKDEVSTTESS